MAFVILCSWPGLPKVHSAIFVSAIVLISISALLLGAMLTGRWWLSFTPVYLQIMTAVLYEMAKNLNLLEKLRLIKESIVKEIWPVSLDEWVDEEWYTMRNTGTVHLYKNHKKIIKYKTNLVENGSATWWVPKQGRNSFNMCTLYFRNMCAWTYLAPLGWTPPYSELFFWVPWLFTIERFHCTQQKL